MSPARSSVTRRHYLGSLAAGAAGAGTAGCLGRIGRAIERDEPSHVSVDIITVPEDEDLYSLRIANHLAGNMEAAGINVDVLPTRPQNLLQDVLINRDFDIYVGRYLSSPEPDFLYAMLHSRFAEEAGWQNPTSFTNTMVDDLLAEQRADPNHRGRLLREIQQLVLDEVPFVPIAFERMYSVTATDRVGSGIEVPPDHPLWPASLVPRNEADEDGRSVLRLGTIDARLTHNLNPLAVDFRGVAGVTNLLYDPLARWDGYEHIPWMARSWEWLSPAGAAAPTMEIDLREDLHWHDGEEVTADDVAFTFRMIQDTTMEAGDPAVPAPRFRWESSLVDAVEAVDLTTVRIQFVETSRRIALWALRVPVLPSHVWFDRTGLTEIGGIEISEQTTDAVITDNIRPVGSGPYECTNVEPDQQVTLQRFTDHFLTSAEPDGPLAAYEEFPGHDRLILELRPSVRNVLEAVRDGGLDGSLSNLGAALTDQATANGDPELTRHETDTTWLLHLGFNLRRIPFTNLGFRRAIAGLIDRKYLLDEVFHGGAIPAVSPVATEAYVPRELAWPTGNAVGFAGEEGSGEVDPDRARQLFRDGGFQYTSDGDLLIQT